MLLKFTVVLTWTTLNLSIIALITTFIDPQLIIFWWIAVLAYGLNFTLVTNILLDKLGLD